MPWVSNIYLVEDKKGDNFGLLTYFAITASGRYYWWDVEWRVEWVIQWNDWFHSTIGRSMGVLKSLSFVGHYNIVVRVLWFIFRSLLHTWLSWSFLYMSMNNCSSLLEVAKSLRVLWVSKSLYQLVSGLGQALLVCYQEVFPGFYSFLLSQVFYILWLCQLNY